MRTVLYGSAALGIATFCSLDAIRSALATSASALIEAAPFAFGATLLTSLFRRWHPITTYLGCGCTSGPSARSVPVAAATWLLFGPLVAIARWIAAETAARILQRRSDPTCEENELLPLSQLSAMVPAALLAGAAAQIFTLFDISRLPPLEGALAGAVFAFAAAPCGLGAIALAGSVHAHAPTAAAAFLCIAGILDLRALGLRGLQRSNDNDAFAYALIATALAVVAWRHGDSLVHPGLSPFLGCCAFAALICAIVHRQRQCAAARIAPGLMLVGALLGAPAPTYHATETTLTDLFPGEHLSFTGALSCERNACAIVRYAITCCRADAAPVAIRLDRPPPYPSGTWLRIDGRVGNIRGDLRLVPERIGRIAPPTDPFIYR